MDRGDAWLLGTDIGPKQTGRSCLMMLSGACGAGEMRSDTIVHCDACSFSSKSSILVREIREMSSDVGARRRLCGWLPFAQAFLNSEDNEGHSGASALISFGNPCKGATCHHVKGSLKEGSRTQSRRRLGSLHEHDHGVGQGALCMHSTPERGDPLVIRST